MAAVFDSRLKFSYSLADNNKKSCEKGKPLERLGRKASGPVMMGSGAARLVER